jgi:aryl-phospho-beta-D-glucosidase BglC (GH1 family)
MAGFSFLYTLLRTVMILLRHLFSFLLLSFCSLVFSQTPLDQAVQEMQRGINLGNTLEPPLEGGWNNPKAQEAYFDLYKDAGYTCVRIPVRWDEHTSDTAPYAIDETWMQRVEEVAGWGLSRGLYVIINAHHEDWIKQNYTNAAYRARFDSIWSQIATRFSNRSEKLLFEILNEPYGLTKAQNDELHQRVLGIIRKTNPDRIVIFQGHNWGGSDELIAARIPDDPRVIGSFHSYDPYLFGLEGQGTWGSAGDMAALTNKFAAVKSWSDAHHIPVLLGEFGAVSSCDYNSRMKHYKMYTELAQQNGFISCAWDDGGQFRILKRSEKKWDEINDILLHTSVQSPKNPVLSVVHDTVIHLAWTNPVAADSFRIERRTPAGEYKGITILPAGSNTYDDFGLKAGNYYHYRILAFHTGAVSLYSIPVRVFLPEVVVLVRTPHPDGVAAPLPGTVEAEDFDAGGEGFTYHDADASNLAGAYRPDEGVDIYSRNDGGYQIGSTVPGEWLEYSVEVSRDGQYTLDCHLAAIQAGGTFSIQFTDGTADTLAAPNSGSWLTTKTVSTVLPLKAGVQIMRLTVLSQPLFNIDKFTFSLPETPTGIDGNPKANPVAVYRTNAGEVVVTSTRENLRSIEIYNITGTLIATQHAYSDRFSAGKLPPGIYIFRIRTEQGITVLKAAVSR